MRVMLLFCLALCSCATPVPVVPSPVPPEPFAIRIDGPATAALGELIVLAAEGQADQFRWLTSAPHLVIDDGRRLAFAAPRAGAYRFVLAAAVSSPRCDLAVVEHLVQVGGGPQPLPSPTPLAAQVRGWFASVSSPSKADEARRLAQSFESVAAQLAAGTLREPAQVLAATAESNRVALGPARSTWAPFFESLRLELNGRTPPLDYAALWREIAAELRACAGPQPVSAGNGPNVSAAKPNCPGGICPVRTRR